MYLEFLKFGFLDEKLDKIRMGPNPILLKEGDKKWGKCK